LEQKSSIEINKAEDSFNDLAYNNLSKTLNEIEQLFISLPVNEENKEIVTSLKEKIALSQTQLTELKSQQQLNTDKDINNIIIKPINYSHNSESIDKKMDLMLNKMDIMLNLINSHSVEAPNDEPVEKVYENGDKYLGQIKNGKKHGKGIMYYSDQSSYDGEWFNDLKNGHGVQNLANGDKYEGNFKNNLKEGYGTYTFKNGRIYEGQFVKDVMEGKGRYKFPTGNEYIGEFQKGLFNGNATFLYSNGDRFEGQYKNGKKSGKGIYYFKSGERFEGEWLKDERHGEGTFYKKNGKTEKQFYENGKIKKTKKSERSTEY
jgi:hypothetical protein